jgi:hypothetical protein
MNRTLTFAMIFALAMPLFAAEPRPVANPTQPTVPDESPLVAAARRANRLGKKPAYVITNENLVTSGGHFTTTEQQIPFVTPLARPAGPTPQAQQQQQTAAQAKAAQEKKAEEERLKVMKQLQMQYEGETLNEDQDPAAIEHHQQQMQKPEKKKQ